MTTTTTTTTTTTLSGVLLSCILVTCSEAGNNCGLWGGGEKRNGGVSGWGGDGQEAEWEVEKDSGSTSVCQHSLPHSLSFTVPANG